MYEIDSKLPTFLKNSIRTFIIGKKEYESSGYVQFEQDCIDLQKSINDCEVERLITHNEAQKLREQYLDSL